MIASNTTDNYIVISMQKSKTQIIETPINHDIYYWSTLEKQNDSGIFFNQRIFFLQSQRNFGYLSDPKNGLTPKTIEKPKALIPIEKIKSVLVNQKDLVIKFTVDENNRKIQRTWLLRASSEALAKKWRDKLQSQKSKDILSKTPPKLIEQESQYRKGVRESSIPKTKKLSFSKTIEFSANPRIEKHSHEVGVSAEPMEELEPIKPFKLIETREYGTMMSQKSQPYPSTKPKEKQVRDANVGTANIPHQEPQQKRQDYSVQEPPLTVKQQPQQIDQPKSIKQQPPAKDKEEPKQQLPHSVYQSYKSQRRPGNIKPLRSQPSGKKVEPSNYPTNKTDLNAQKIENNNPKETPDYFTNRAEKNPSVVSVPEAEVTITRSKTQKPKSPEPQQQREVRETLYYERTSRLIKQSSIASKQPPQPVKSAQIAQPYDKPQQAKQLPFIQATQQKRKDIPDRQGQATIPKAQTSRIIQSQHRFNQYPVIKEENDSAVDSLEYIPWTFKYIKYREHIFGQFVQYTQDLLRQLLKDLSLPQKDQFYTAKFTKNGIRYYEINDIEVKLAAIQLVKPATGAWKEREKICSKESIKILQNEYNNYQALYEYLGADSRLKVPLVCLNEINGTVALFKIVSVGLEQPIKMRQLQSELESLKTMSKIDHNFYHNSQKYLLQLNPHYYNKFKMPNNEYDLHVSFDCVFIQELDGFLLQDLVTDNEDGRNALLRKELLKLYAENPLKSDARPGHDQPQRDKQKGQSEEFGENIFKAISDAIRELDSLQVYFFNSKELARYLHNHGINIRYLGYLYSYLQTKFQKQMIMSELAARTCKTLFRKTVQDLTIEEYPSPKDFNLKICDFLNCILGNTFETAAIWKLLSSHCQHYFCVQINFEEIHRGYFLISLVQNCKLDVLWERINPDEIFKSNFFFSQRNLKGVKPSHKIYPPFYNVQFQNTVEIILKEETEEGFETLLTDLFLDSSPLPDILNPIAPDVKKYLAYFVNPAKPSLPHLHIYTPSAASEPSRITFDIGLIEVKWLLKLKIKEKYIKSCDELIQKATKFYGEYHPIFSELYDIFSAYHSSHGEYQDAITFAKSSLVNTLSICGTQHQKTSQCYYFLGLYYLQASRAEQAVHNLKKAKKILQHNDNTNTMSYAAILVKLALLHLNQSQAQLCLTYSEEALKVFEGMEADKCEDQLTECYEMMARCYEIERNMHKLRQISQRIGTKLIGIMSRSNLQKMMKMYLYPILSDLSSQSASSYLDIIAKLPKQIDQNSEDIAFGFIRDRLADGNFESSLYQYLKRIQSIEEYISQADVLKGWVSFNQVHERQTVNDFLSLTEQLVVFLGQGFITGALREAL